MTEQQVEQKPDRKDLKIQAYQQKVAEQDNTIADLRVELTIYAEEIQRLQEFEPKAKAEEVAEDVPQKDTPKPKKAV